MQKPRYTNTSLHEALNRKYPKTGICEGCGGRSATYALIHGREYSLDRNDYLELCFNCHGGYDHHTIDTIECSCEERSVKYKHGKAYELIEREDAVLKTCEYSICNNQFWTTLSRKKYCSSQCKVASFKETKGIETPLREGRICKREGCSNVIDADKKLTVKYCSNSCRQKIYHERHRDKEQEQRNKQREINQREREKQEEKKAVDDFIKELMGE